MYRRKKIIYTTHVFKFYDYFRMNETETEDRLRRALIEQLKLLWRKIYIVINIFMFPYDFSEYNIRYYILIASCILCIWNTLTHSCSSS